MAGYLHALRFHGIIKKLVLRLIPTVENLLYDMIAVDVFAHFLDSVLEEVLDHDEMLIDFDDFNEFLH